jgi:glycogen operon protein
MRAATPASQAFLHRTAAYTSGRDRGYRTCHGSSPHAEIWPGEPFPLGATYDGTGTNFSLFSEVATRVELCLFDDGRRERASICRKSRRSAGTAIFPECSPGSATASASTAVGARAGHWCNPNKLLLDPYAKAIDGEWTWNESMFPYHFDNPTDRRTISTAPRTCRSRWSSIRRSTGKGDTAPRPPWHKTIVYETHVKGFTRNNPKLPEHVRGSYGGLATPRRSSTCRSSGSPPVELLPVHQFVRDSHLLERGLRNYWGYNSIGYLAPHNEYSSSGTRGEQVKEFKGAVKALHRAGIEVILDVVYNHTAEGIISVPCCRSRGSTTPPTTGRWRQSRYYMDYTGTGNTLNMMHPHVLQLLMDSLRYWVLEMHVGRLPLRSGRDAARELHDVDRLGSFFDLIQQDPVINRSS